MLRRFNDYGNGPLASGGTVGASARQKAESEQTDKKTEKNSFFHLPFLQSTRVKRSLPFFPSEVIDKHCQHDDTADGDLLPERKHVQQIQPVS